MENARTSDRVQMDELLFPPPDADEPFPVCPFPVETGCEVYGEPVDSPATGIELPRPVLAVNNELQALWSETVLLGPDVLQLTGPPPVLIDLVLLRLPLKGTLLRDGFALQVGDLFTQEDIDCGRISYRHEGEANGRDTFVFSTPAGELAPTELTIVIQNPATAPTPCSDASGLAETLAETVAETEEKPPSPKPSPELLTEPSSGLLSEPTAEPVPCHPNPSAEQPFDQPVAAESPQPTATDSSAPQATPAVLLPFPPGTLPTLPPPWRVPFRVEAVCGTGLALVRLEGAGVWQYSRDHGVTWHDVGRVYHGWARLLQPTDQLRFVPYRGGTGRVTLGARAWRPEGSVSAEYACLASQQALQSHPEFGTQLLHLRWTLDR